MDDEKLCQWLRENGSGVYRPSKEAADRIESLRAELKTLRMADDLHQQGAEEMREEAARLKGELAAFRLVRAENEAGRINEEWWANMVADRERLKAELAALKAAAVHIYNSGYHAGHHDTVEGWYVDIHPSDMDSYHTEEVTELREALAKLEASDE